MNCVNYKYNFQKPIKSKMRLQMRETDIINGKWDEREI